MGIEEETFSKFSNSYSDKNLFIKKLNLSINTKQFFNSSLPIPFKYFSRKAFLFNTFWEIFNKFINISTIKS